MSLVLRGALYRVIPHARSRAPIDTALQVLLYSLPAHKGATGLQEGRSPPHRVSTHSGPSFCLNVQVSGEL